jgi:hypothetical protein
VYLTASSLKRGRFCPSLHPSVVREHRPASDDDWNELFGRLRQLSRERWIQRHLEILRKLERLRGLNCRPN